MNIINQFNTDGFCIVKKVLTNKQCKNIKNNLEKNYLKLSKLYANNKGKLNDNKTEKIVYNLHNKNLEYIKIASDKKITNILDKLFSFGSYENDSNYILRQLTARSPLKGSLDQQLHNDSRFAGSINPLLIVAQVAVEDFKPDNGPIRVIPRSQKKDFFPKKNYKYPNERKIFLKKGECLIFNGALWHGGCKNTTLNTRWALLFTYARWFYKSAFDFNANIPRNIYESLNKKQKFLLGYNTIPPIDEFTRISSKSKNSITPKTFYKLPK